MPEFLLPILVVLAVFCLLYLLSLRGRRNHKEISELKRWYYAHRGLHRKGIPENSLAAFRKAIQKGYGCELDIHLMKDGNLAVIHDSSLKRTADADITIEELTAADLINYRLEGSEERIPLFSQVLELFEGHAPLIVELKTASDNYVALCETAVRELKDYKGLYCVESFDPRCILWLKSNHPEIIRGQLAENWFKAKVKLHWLLRWLLTTGTYSFLLKPDFIAYNFPHRKTLGNFLSRKLWGVTGVSWTIRNKKDFEAAVNEGLVPIFEGFEP